MFKQLYNIRVKVRNQEPDKTATDQQDPYRQECAVILHPHCHVQIVVVVVITFACVKRG